jgi:UDP-2-acetamido-3-amino-2,3-dideoxy-glucuronate N-acetyltransferase
MDSISKDLQKAVNVHIGEGATIQEGCSLGYGAYLCAGISLGKGVHVGPNVTFAEAIGLNMPRTQVQERCIVEANATIRGGVVLHSGAVIRAGAVVTRNVPPMAIVEGNPANIVGYVDAMHGTGSVQGTQGTAKVEQTSVTGVTIHHFPLIPDLRGNLTVGEFDRQIPFTPLRYFMVFGVPNREIRGEHAHRECHQFLICTTGSCSVVADDGLNRAEITLDRINSGVHLPPMTWGIQYKYSPGAVLLVFASHHYDPADYIRDYREFLSTVKANPAT